MGSKQMVQSFHWTADYWRHKKYGINRNDVVICGTQVGKVVSIATAFLKVPEVLVQFRESEEWFPSEQVKKL